MEYVYIGKIVNTHGIKGEVRVISDFEKKEIVFKKGFKIYIKEKEFEINSYRVHKNYDMITFKNYNDINDVLEYKGQNIYIKRTDLKDDIFLKTDLIGYDAIYKEKNIGKICGFFNNKKYDLMIIKENKKEHLVPYLEEFIENIDKENMKIYITNMEGLIDEN